jgi:3-dehydroquinate dehydratase, type II
MLHIAIINGPNLNLLGTREQEKYGKVSFEDYLTRLKARFPNVILSYYQSNIEGELINHMHNSRYKASGIILNAGAYSHTSIAIADAITAISLPVVEVHISNINAREEYRKHSFTAARCVGSITGLGLEGYALAIQYFIDRAASQSKAPSISS